MLTGKELGDAVAAAIALKGVTKKAVADHFGIAPPSVQDWIKRGTIAKDKLEDLWLYFSDVVGPDHWGLATVDMQAGSNVLALDPEDELPEDVVQIPEYKVRFSGGNGNTAIDYELSEESEPATYRRSWMQRLHLNPEKLKRFKVKGDSMESLLYNGDSVLVNLAENDIKQLIDGKIYAIRYGNELRVKRLYRKLDGSLVLRSENLNYKDEDVPPALVQQHITIIGRVRDKSGAGGL